MFLLIRKESWHINGVAYEPHEVFKKIDVAFNALHGEYGEDGKVQKNSGHFFHSLYRLKISFFRHWDE